MTITELVEKAHKNATDKGFYEKTESLIEALRGALDPIDKEDNKIYDELMHSIISTRLMLIVSELGEALEALRNNNFSKQHDIDVVISIKDDEAFKRMYDDYIKGTFEEEIADVPIRLADISKYLGIDLEKHIQAKMRYNSMRPKLHGKEF